MEEESTVHVSSPPEEQASSETSPTEETLQDEVTPSPVEEEETISAQEPVQKEAPSSPPKPRSTNPVPAPAPAATSGGGWGGWGSWLSSTVSQVVDKSSQLVQDLTAELDEEAPTPSAPKLYRTEEDVETEKQKNNSVLPRQAAPKFYRTDEEVAQEQDLEDQLIASTAEVFSETTSFLNAVLTRGFDHLHQLDVETLRSQAESLGTSTREMSGKWVHQTVDAIGVAGERARAALAQMQGPEGASPLPSETNSGASSPLTGEGETRDTEAEKSRPATFTGFYDEAMGNVYLQALELLSTECTMKVQEAQRKCPSEQLPQLIAYLGLLSDQLEEEPEEPYEGTLTHLSEKAQAVQQALEEMREKAKQEVASMPDTLKAKLAEMSVEKKDTPSEEEEKEEESSPAPEGPSHEQIVQCTNDSLDALHAQELQITAQMAASCVELINRVLEGWLVSAQQEDMEGADHSTLHKPEASLDQAMAFQTLANQLADDVSEIATKYVQTARTLVSVAITHLKDEKDQEGSNALREKSKALINRIYSDTGDGIAKIHESKEFALPVLQWMYLRSEAYLSE